MLWGIYVVVAIIHKNSHQTSHLFITTVGARWQYFPTRNQADINDFSHDSQSDI